MYTLANMQESIKKVEATRAQRMANEPRRMTADEKDALLAAYHPDYKEEGFITLKVGPNKGEKVPTELGYLLESNSRILGVDIDLDKVDYDVDVLVIGAGGAGSSAAIEAHEAGANVMITTKLRIGDANTMMAEGGIQAADKENDSPAQHYLDAFGGGHFAARPELLRKLVMEAPDAISWLENLGVMFDKDENGRMVTTHGGGTSRKRMHACRDYSGAEIMRTLRDEVINRGIPVVEFSSAVELIKDDKGQVAGAVLQNMETGEYQVAKAKTVIIATGGAGRLHYNNFPTSNHYGATADGLILGYRAGAPLLYQDTIQYQLTTEQDGATYQYAMVAYDLYKTLTDNGHVARGICTADDQNHLVGIHERTRIENHGGQAEYTEDDGATWTGLPQGTIVSMNLWGFTPSILIELKRRFLPFLEDVYKTNPLKGEYFLPFVVDELLQEKKAEVTVLRSYDNWYGVTYKEDKENVMAALQKLKDEGRYPQKLWEE